MAKTIDLAAKPEKITDEQLKEVQQVISLSNQIKLEIGNIAARKHSLLHDLDGVNKKMNEIHSELEKQYGKFDLDINTGKITYPNTEANDDTAH